MKKLNEFIYEMESYDSFILLTESTDMTDEIKKEWDSLPDDKKKEFHDKDNSGFFGKIKSHFQNHWKKYALGLGISLSFLTGYLIAKKIGDKKMETELRKKDFDTDRILSIISSSLTDEYDMIKNAQKFGGSGDKKFSVSHGNVAFGKEFSVEQLFDEKGIQSIKTNYK